MQPCLPRFRKFFILACIIYTTQCVDTKGSSPGAPLPAGSDFALTRTRFEERQNGRTLWKGTGIQAQGDVSRMAVQDLRLKRIPQTERQASWTLYSPDANLDFQAGTGQFTPLRLVDNTGHTITSGHGLYNEAAGVIDLSPPLLLSSATLEAKATSARVNLTTNQVDVTGPVEGTFSHAPFEL